MKDRYFDNCHIAGFMFYEGADVFSKLKIGTELQLVSEPENKYDAHAVAIYWKEAKLGFLPRTHNKQISKFLQTGYTDLFVVKINRVCADEHPEQQVSITIKIREKV